MEAGEAAFSPSVMLMETSVFSTIFLNSSKLIFPSRSRSASMMVLSTICEKAQVSRQPALERSLDERCRICEPGYMCVCVCVSCVATNLLQLLVL